MWAHLLALPDAAMSDEEHKAQGYGGTALIATATIRVAFLAAPILDRGLGPDSERPV